MSFEVSPSLVDPRLERSFTIYDDEDTSLAQSVPDLLKHFRCHKIYFKIVLDISLDQSV